MFEFVKKKMVLCAIGTFVKPGLNNRTLPTATLQHNVVDVWLCENFEKDKPTPSSVANAT